MIASFIFNLTLDWEDYEAKERDTHFKNDFANFGASSRGSIVHKAKAAL